MTFEEWWGGDRDRTTAYDLMKVLSEAAAQAWRAAEAATQEEMLAQWNHTGVDIDAALHGRVNEESPIANRLRMIALGMRAAERIQRAKETRNDDTQRLNWLESHHGADIDAYRDYRNSSLQWELKCLIDGAEREEHGSTLREALDAAMERWPGTTGAKEQEAES